MIDHRKLGRELGIFHSAPQLGAGLPIWLPEGAAARHAIEEYLYGLERRAGYRHVYSPPLAKREVYERSGHLPHFADEMFPPMPDGEEELYLRPGLCPHHALVFASRGRSYRELPLRIGELGPMYRMERSGVLGGLSRVRAISLNDAHIFCAEDQVVAEVGAVVELMRRAHRAVGIEPVRYRLSLPGEGGKYVRDAPWERAVDLLREALDNVRLSYVEEEGEAAFYGPKLDVQIADPAEPSLRGGSATLALPRNAARRESTLSTIQVDFHQPARFGLSYVDASGRRQRPVMVHRSLLGSMERLMAHLLEVHDGALPVWCAPVQVLALPVADEQVAAADRFAARAVDAGLRAEVRAGGSLGARVREAAQRRIPHIAVIGAREAEADEVALRGRDGDPLAAQQALAHLAAACAPPL